MKVLQLAHEVCLLVLQEANVVLREGLQHGRRGLRWISLVCHGSELREVNLASTSSVEVLAVLLIVCKSSTS